MSWRFAPRPWGYISPAVIPVCAAAPVDRDENHPFPASCRFRPEDSTCPKGSTLCGVMVPDRVVGASCRSVVAPRPTAPVAHQPGGVTRPHSGTPGTGDVKRPAFCGRAHTPKGLESQWLECRPFGPLPAPIVRASEWICTSYTGLYGRPRGRGFGPFPAVSRSEYLPCTCMTRMRRA